MSSTWLIEKNSFETVDIEMHGSKFLLGNGYMGYRGTMEEYTAAQLVAINLAGFFDLAEGSNWRESVNAPNPLYTVTEMAGTQLNISTLAPISHRQVLDIRHGLHQRETTFSVNGTAITLRAERFVSMARENIMVLSYSLEADRAVTLTVKTGIDADIWSISGTHLRTTDACAAGDMLVIKSETVQKKNPLFVYEAVSGLPQATVDGSSLLRTATVTLQQGEVLTFTKFGGVYHSEALSDSESNFRAAVAAGYEALKAEHMAKWDAVWDRSDVVIEGDEEAQLALRYSIYHLCSIAPHNTDKCGIPARGLSGQVYKGAAFWDTEMFMLPFFQFTDEQVARNLLRYRVNTLDGARRKAREFGHEGAFFAWESQETGDDACTLFNVTDIFTGRPLRTYFKDKQIHVSADVVFALWDYCRTTGDYSILRDGGMTLIYECVWFYYTYSSFRAYKNRYELLDVVGPDEYHERVDNNAFTNVMVKHAAHILVAALDKMKECYPDSYAAFAAGRSLDWAADFAERLYVPQPDENGIIPQFDSYMAMEDVTPADLKGRELKENEYWGCHGLASTTRVLKQADVLMMLNVFRNEYSKEVKQANWDFYEPYTEHGSSLSACAYAIVAAGIGYTDWAYRYFMKTACVDLTGSTRQYLGSLYIGGTHPAANGGSWNTAIFGFAGVSFTDEVLDISPALPTAWKKLSFKLMWKGEALTVTATQDGVTVTGAKQTKVTVYGKSI